MSNYPDVIYVSITNPHITVPGLTLVATTRPGARTTGLSRHPQEADCYGISVSVFTSHQEIMHGLVELLADNEITHTVTKENYSVSQRKVVPSGDPSDIIAFISTVVVSGTDNLDRLLKIAVPAPSPAAVPTGSRNTIRVLADANGKSKAMGPRP